MAVLTRQQERHHAQACELVDLARDLTEDERGFVLDHWLASATSHSASDRAYFTPEGLARDMAVEVGGDRIVDLCAGIGRLASHNGGLWSSWPHPGPELVCVERNPDYVRVGRRVLPEARWVCADVLDPAALPADLGQFDCAVANPPFGPAVRTRNAPGGYTGRRFEYHVIAAAATLAKRGVFIIPQASAPFRYSGQPQFEPARGDDEYRRFVAATGIALTHNCGIDTSHYDGDWVGVSPRVEIVLADFTTRSARCGGRATGARHAAAGTQLTLLG